MKKLNLFLMMFASLSLFAISSCNNKNDKQVEPEITLSVSGGATVELNGADIAKDIIVTASEKATRDIVVNITSNAAEGEAAIEPAQVTIKKGELTATSKITFSATKFPEGTDQKKITVTIATSTEHVKPDVATTDFLVSGIGGKKLIPLTIAGSATELNTTTAEQALTVTATLTTAATEEVSIAIAYDGSSANLIELFKEIKTIVIAKDATTGTATFPVGKGVEGELKLAFSTTNITVDLQTKSLAATFAVDKNDLTITGNNTTFETYEGPQTFTVSYTLAEALTEELDIALTYDGSADDIKALFATRTSIKIAAGETTGSENFIVSKGLAGKLVIGFATTNTDVAIKPASLTATFTYTVPPITPLCEILAGELNNTWAYLAGFKIGETEVNITRADGAYINKLGETIANIADGGEVKVYGAGNGDPISAHVWVDWNKDDQVTADEMVGSTKTEVVTEETPNKEFLVFNFKAPENTLAGEYKMRIGTNYGTGQSGCANPGDNDVEESRTAYDLTINYTPGGGSVEPSEDPTFALVKANNDPIVVPATGDFEATFNVTLSKASEETQTVNLVVATSTAGKSGTLSTASVEFAASETTKPVTIKFASTDFTADNITADVTVTGSSSLEATTPAITYNVKGTAVVAPPTKQELDCFLEKPTDNNDQNVFFNDGQTSRVIDFYVASNKLGQVGDITFDVTVTGDGVTPSDYSFTGVTAGKITMKEPATTQKGRVAFQVTINESAIGKTLSVNIDSQGTTIQADYKSRLCIVQRLSIPSKPLDYQISFTDDEGTTLTEEGYRRITFHTKDNVTPSQPLKLVPVTTGDVEIGTMEDYIMLTRDGQTADIYVAGNLDDLANGAKGTLTFESKFTNFAPGAGITYTIQK